MSNNNKTMVSKKKPYLGEDAEEALRGVLGSEDDGWTTEAIQGLTIKCYEKNGLWVKWIVYLSGTEDDDDEGPFGEGGSLAEALRAYLVNREARSDAA